MGSCAVHESEVDSGAASVEGQPCGVLQERSEEAKQGVLGRGVFGVLSEDWQRVAMRKEERVPRLVRGRDGEQESMFHRKAQGREFVCRRCRVWREKGWQLKKVKTKMVT